MKAKITCEKIQRIERYFVHDAALREALLNALCHKQYESCTPIQISVYDDRLYITNWGKLPENWTIDRLMSNLPPVHITPLLLMYIIWLASLKAGDAVSKKFVRLAKRTAHHYRNTQFILAIL